MLGNQSISASVWRGQIDTREPRVVMTATASGASYFDAAANQQLYEIRFVCAAVDRNPLESSFQCPGEGLAEPVRSFESLPTLQTLFPDVTIRSGLAISYTAWLPSLAPAATARACDSFGRCAQASTPAAAAAAPKVLMTMISPAAAPGAPQAVVVAPTNGSFVATTAPVGVAVAAEARAALKIVTLSLDNTVVQTLSFAQSDNVTRTLRTLSLAIAAEDQHTLVVRASDWAGATQSTVFSFTGGAGATRFECSLDGAAWAACTSPKQYSGLGVGDHVFAVRARDAANKAGSADRANWTIINDVPVAASQSVVVIPNQAKALMLTATDNDALNYTIITPPARRTRRRGAEPDLHSQHGLRRHR